MSKHGFKELAVWQRSKKLAVKCLEISKMLGGPIKARRRFASKVLCLMATGALGAVAALLLP
jgi:hypothetical protein